MSEGLRLDSSWGLRIFLSHARHKTKNIFPYFSIEFKTHHLSYDSIHTEHDAIDIADPSGMQDTCHTLTS